MGHHPQSTALAETDVRLPAVDVQGLALASLPIDVFGRKRGMRSSQIHQTLISEDGRLWCASPVGLVCYDGVTIRLFGRKNGLRYHGLRALAKGPDNTLLLGSDAGVETVDISGTAPKSIKFSLLGIVASLAVKDAGGVVATPNGLYCLTNDGTFQHSDNYFLSKARVTATLVDKRGDTWITGPKFGLAVYTGDEWVFFSPEDYGHIGIPRTLCLGEDETVLVGGQYGLAVMTAEKRLSHTLQTAKPVTALHCAEGYIWTAMGESLVRLKRKGGKIVVHDKVMDHTIINDIMSDSFKNVWVSTDDQGLHRVSGLHHIYKTDQATDLGAVLCIKTAKSGKLIGGARGLNLPNAKTILSGIAVWDALEDREGAIWAATEQGLFKHSPLAQPDSEPMAFGHNHEALAAPGRIVLFYENALYVGSTKGLVRIDANGPKEILRPNGNSLGYVYSLHIGPRGKLWIATLGVGLWILNRGRITPVLNGSVSKKGNVYALCHAPSGTLFVSHDEYISTIEADGRPELFVNSREPIAAWALEATDDETLLAGTTDGLVIYDRATREVVKRVSNNTDTSNWEFTCSRALYVDDGDQVLCGVSSGLKIINMSRLMEMDDKPQAALARVKWHQAHTKFSKNCYHVEAGSWRFEVELQSSWFLDEDDCQMRFRLNGFDQVWSTLRPIHTITYTSLPPGKYSLEACLQSPIAGQGAPKKLMDIVVR